MHAIILLGTFFVYATKLSDTIVNNFSLLLCSKLIFFLNIKIPTSLKNTHCLDECDPSGARLHIHQLAALNFAVYDTCVLSRLF